jgi:broad specificity phosphatase PhoE
MKPILSAFIALAILAGAAPPAPAQIAQSFHGIASLGDAKAIAAALRVGGNVILVRHRATFSNQADTDPFNLADLSKQRNLNDRGKELAKAFGAAVRAAEVPVGGVYTSQFNRAYETAHLVGFKDIKTTADLSEGGLVLTPDENNRRAKALREMLARVPAKEKNDILITHKPNIVDALGKDWFDVKEGEASIFTRLEMDDWTRWRARANNVWEATPSRAAQPPNDGCFAGIRLAPEMRQGCSAIALSRPPHLAL